MTNTKIKGRRKASRGQTKGRRKASRGQQLKKGKKVKKERRRSNFNRLNFLKLKITFLKMVTPENQVRKHSTTIPPETGTIAIITQ